MKEVQKLFSDICVLTLIVFATNPVFEVEGMRGAAPDAAAALARPQDQLQIRPVLVTPAEGSTVINRADVERCGAHHATAVEIPANVTEIVGSAFWHCQHLETVIFANGSQLRDIDYGAFQGCSQLREINIPESVTNIGSHAFRDCVALERVTFAANSQLKSIGWSAFEGCSYLRSFEIPENASHIGEEAFAGTPVVTSEAFKRIVLTAENIDRGSTEYVIPESVRIIADGAFGNCINLKAVTIGSQLRIIGHRAFRGCTALEFVHFYSDSLLRTIGMDAFSGCSQLREINIPNNITKIGIWAFRGCSQLREINIPESVAEIGEGAFVRCKALERVTFAKHSQLRDIDYGAFRGCSQLREINIPESVTNIGSHAFRDCVALERVTFAANSQLKSIKSSAFEGCSYLRSFEIPENASHIGEGAFAGTPVVTSEAFKRIVLTAEHIDKNSTEYVVPESVRIIADGAFENCINLKAVTIGSQLRIIGRMAFIGCTALEFVHFYSDSPLQVIDGYAFFGCSQLREIHIPKSVTEIRWGAFSGCTALESVTNIPIALEDVGSDIFERCGKLQLLAFAAKEGGYTEEEYKDELRDILNKSNEGTKRGWKLPEAQINAIVERSIQFARDNELIKAE